MKKDATMSKLSLASYLALSLAVGWYAPEAAAAKVERDPTVSANPVPPKKTEPKAVAPAPDLPKLTAAQIADKNVAARGGLDKWRAVQSIKMTGRMEVGGKANNEVPFTLQMKRPNKQRLAMEFGGKTAVQVFDGEHGWKFRPFLNRNDVEPFTADEAKTEASRSDLDGPLIDYAAKGTKVELDGVEQVEGQPAYKLKVTPKSGGVKHVWIDAKTFLDVKMDGFPKHMDGKMHPVYVYQRDFRSVQGVMIPFVVETAVDGYTETHKLLVEKASINPQLDDSLFSKPHA
jgi:outer membrane lipoprotein-sorting protein